MSGRLRGLDALRAVAVLLVLGGHAATVAPAPRGTAGLDPVLAAWTRGGWVGVDLFFVLSGYLVAGLVLREHAGTGAFRPWRFLARRGLKIYPAFWALLAATVAVSLLRGAPVAPGPLLVELLFLQSYAVGLWNHTWSLAVEEHFYLLLALGLWLLGRRPGPRPLAPLVAAAALALPVCFALRVAWARARPDWPAFLPSHLRLDGLLLGAALSYMSLHHPDGRLLGAVRRAPRAVLLLGAAGLAPAFGLELHRLGPVGLSALLTLQALAGGALLLGALHAPAPGPRAGRVVDALAALGAWSYSIYLWHMFLGWRVREALRWLDGAWPLRPHLLEVAAYLAAALVGGIALGRAIELPFLRLRDRLLPSRAGDPVPLPAAPPVDRRRLRLLLLLLAGCAALLGAARALGLAG